MARHTGPKNKKQRRVNTDLGLKTNAQKVARRLNIPPGQHGRRGRRRMSEYGVQLQEKQKVKWMYGVLEAQLRRYYKQATKNPSATGTELLRLLEQRLDNVVYRLGFAPTRAAARQMVVHGHVEVDGEKVDRPSYQVKPEQTVSLTKKGRNIPYVKELLEVEGFSVPEWLEREAVVGKVTSRPERKDMSQDVQENLIIEFYSR